VANPYGGANIMISLNDDHILHIGGRTEILTNPADDRLKLRRRIEPWLSSVFQSEHLSLLVGNGLRSRSLPRSAASSCCLHEAHGAGQACKLLTLDNEIGREALGHGKAGAGGLDVIGDLHEFDLGRMSKDQARH